MKTLVITGASSGIGLETAKVFQNEDYSIVNLSRKKIPLDGSTHLETDLSDSKALENNLHKAVNLVKDSDQICLVHNASNMASDNAEEIDADQMMEDMFGIDFDYGEAIPKTSDIGIGTAGTFGQLERNIAGLRKYVKISLEGPPMGANYFVITGKCSGGDHDGENMHTFIRNIPTGKSIFGSKYRGLTPGIVEDVNDVNPFKLFKKLFTVGGTKSDNLSESIFVAENNSIYSRAK